MKVELTNIIKRDDVFSEVETGGVVQDKKGEFFLVCEGSEGYYLARLSDGVLFDSYEIKTDIFYIMTDSCKVSF